jgi:hypothetical protein
MYDIDGYSGRVKEFDQFLKAVSLPKGEGCAKYFAQK